MEYISLTSIILLVVGIMFAFAAVTINENTRFNSAYYAVSILANAADEVSTRNGSVIVAEVELPSGIISFSTFKNEVIIEMNSAVSAYNVYEYSKASLEPTNFSTDEGTHFIAVQSTDTNITFTEI